MPNIKPYRLHRTWHLAAMLDELQGRGELRWSYSYDKLNSRALFNVTLEGEQPKTLHTREAEGLAQSFAHKLEIPWVPVSHPGGETQWEEAAAAIRSLKLGTADACTP